MNSHEEQPRENLTSILLEEIYNYAKENFPKKCAEKDNVQGVVMGILADYKILKGDN